MTGHDETQSNVLKALADENRLRLLRLLWHEELNVHELGEILEMPQPKVSRHLSTLRAARFVQDRREGSRVYYALSPLEGDLAPIRNYLEGIAAHAHPDLERMAVVLRRRTRISRDFAQQRADEWDSIGLALHSTTAALFAFAQLAPRGLTVADLGTGTGMLLPVLSRFASEVWAIDHSEEMLAHARERCRDLELSNVKFLACQLEELRIHLPAVCDGLLLHFVLHQVARPGSLLRRLVPCLRPGGRLVIVDHLPHSNEDARTRFGSQWLGFEPERLTNWCHEAGLSECQVQPLPNRHDDDGALGLFVASAGTPLSPPTEQAPGGSHADDQP